jgi:glycosyltransferase involved in cell wall biosynthesis
MNILYITNHLNIGGISSYVLTLGSGLKKRGHNVYIASSGGQLLKNFTEAGFTYITIPINTKKEISPKIIFSLFKLRRAHDKYKFDIIHAHTRTTQVLGYWLGRLEGIAYLSTCHGFFKRRILRRIFGCWGKKVIAISEPVRAHLVSDFKVKEQDIAVIHNGIDIEKFARGALDEGRERKGKLGLKDGPVIGIVARLSDVKGHSYLIEAMKDVVGAFPQAQLLIVGDGKEKENLLRQVNKLNISGNIIFHPQVYDINEVLSVMDIFVMPSLKEGLGLSLMEAMGSGLAVVGSDIGGIKSLIQDGYNGFMVKPADASGLAVKILTLLRDNDKRQMLGQRAREFILRNFPQSKTIIETEGVYAQCLK